MNEAKWIGENSSDAVLIDTWWNVNQEPEEEKVGADAVLIDTWWNVNTKNRTTSSPRLRF